MVRRRFNDRRAMAVANAPVDIPALEGPPSPGQCGGSAGRAAAPSTTRPRAAVRRVTRHRIPGSVGKNSEEILGLNDLP